MENDNDNIKKKLNDLYTSLNNKNKNIDNIIINIDKLVSEEKNDYINNLLYPEDRKNQKIPNFLPVPTSTFQLHNSYMLDDIVTGDGVYVFNPFFIYDKTIEVEINNVGNVYYSYYGEPWVYKAYGDVPSKDVLHACWLSSFYKTNFDFTFLGFQNQDPVERDSVYKLSPINIKQGILPLYSQYRLVSACITVKFIGRAEHACGKIGGIIINDKFDSIGGRYNVFINNGGIFSNFPYVDKKFNKYLDYNFVHNMFNYKEFDCLDGIRMIYYPIDNSHEEFLPLFNHNNISYFDFKINNQDFSARMEDMKMNNIHNDFNFFIYIIGGVKEGMGTDYRPRYKFDIYCNFECIVNDKFMSYIQVDLNIKSLSDEEKKEAIEIIQGKSIKSINEEKNLVDWKYYLNKLKKRNSIRTYNMIVDKINENEK